MAQIPDIIITFTKALVIGLFGIISFFIVDIHQMVKTDHDSVIAFKGESSSMQRDINSLQEKDKGIELLLNKILAVLPDNDFDVSPKEKQKRDN